MTVNPDDLEIRFPSDAEGAARDIDALGAKVKALGRVIEEALAFQAQMESAPIDAERERSPAQGNASASDAPRARKVPANGPYDGRKR